MNRTPIDRTHPYFRPEDESEEEGTPTPELEIIETPPPTLEDKRWETLHRAIVETGLPDADSVGQDSKARPN